jgi:hypothetical protein
MVSSPQLRICITIILPDISRTSLRSMNSQAWEGAFNYNICFCLLSAPIKLYHPCTSNSAYLMHKGMNPSHKELIPDKQASTAESCSFNHGPLLSYYHPHLHSKTSTACTYKARSPMTQHLRIPLLQEMCLLP